ncbi:phosphotransferase [Streptomyces sp. NPDC057806]|uniref:phosphotransferase n=1 Tax=Streptomyces sp. NPDC057806 TaxID=3346255 RepID=UPI0036C8D226
MGAPPLPGPFSGERAANAAVRAFVAQAARRGRATSGHHNRNYVLPLTEDMARRLGRPAGTQVTVRMRRPGALPVVIRTWQDETEILGAVGRLLPHVPQCLAKGPGFAIHSYVEGTALSAVCADDKPLDTLLVKALADVFARMAQVRREALPRLPACWPRNDKDSQGFLRTLAHLADQQIHRQNRQEFGGLFAALGIPEDALLRFAERVPSMARRPYALLHTDLHRANLILPFSPEPPLFCVDWELAGYGDPLHDLATHLVRMRYPSHQWEEVVEAWAEAMRPVRPAAVNGLAKDLGHYVAFERAQSLYPDVLRAAASLRDLTDERSLHAAAARVHGALRRAARPLGLRNIPGEPEIGRILFRWREARTGGHGLHARIRDWDPVHRIAEHPRFPRSAVREALYAEGAAPAGRVFKGTGHLNSVVRVPGVDFAVVVRRKVANACRRERGFLSEHAVLRAIERSRVEVAAPKFLALGTSYQGEPFAIHTYEGPRDIGRPPGHPVHGLRPHEADRLVDQLGALTRVNYREVDPAAGEGLFHSWLSEQLVLLVAELPKESQRLARLLGLPDAPRLRQILARHRVGERRPALLHGDLNPWNLVRRSDELALTLIDWEMAVVGDPLYDLVRHMHLTPTRPEIRDRMFRRWAQRLDPEFTADWQRDWRVYRWIEIVRSAYIDLDRLVTGESLDAPNVRRAVDSYAMTLASAIGSLGLPHRPNPHLPRALT